MEDEKPLSERLTDNEIAQHLKAVGLDDTAENIDLVRDSRKKVEKKLKEREEGKPAQTIIKEAELNALHRN